MLLKSHFIKCIVSNINLENLTTIQKTDEALLVNQDYQKEYERLAGDRNKTQADNRIRY